MTKIRTIISALFLLIFCVWTVSGQGECALDVESIIERVTDECADIGENEVCYGNRNVSAIPRLNTVNFMFENPGDLADLYNVQSLVVDSVDIQNDTWGVAQMRLLVGSDRGLQDITMLLFGEFDVENAVESTETLELRITTLQKAIHLAPTLDSAQLEVVDSGNTLIGLARLEDSSWLRVENPVTRVVGWIENNGIVPANNALSVGILPVQDSSTPYFGAMQAFYFENGSSDIGCDTVESDGLIIQTPEGAARVSLLINEVSIELLGGRNEAGDNISGTAFIQANPLSGQDMSVNVVQGSATVQTEEGEQEVQAGQRTSIPISVNLSPSGAPEEPEEFEIDSVNVGPLIPAVSAPRNNPSTNGQIAINTSSGGGSNGGSSSGDDGSNNSGNSSNTTGSSSNSGSSNGGNSSGSSSGSGSSSSSNSSNNGSSGISSSGQGTGISTSINANTGGALGFGQQGNIIALSIAVISGLVVISFIVWYTRRNRV